MVKRVLLVLLFLVAYSGFSVGKAEALRLEVEIENFTSGQALQSPVVAAGASVGVYALGQKASMALDKFAEGADCSGVAVALTQGGAKAVCNQGKIVFGRSGLIADLVISPSGVFVTVVAKLNPTNDGFAGVQWLWVPNTLVKGVWYTADIKAFDAGGEYNDEMCNHLFSSTACGFLGQGYSATPEPNQENRVQYHPGLHGKGNLVPAVNGFATIVGRIRYRIVE